MQLTSEKELRKAEFRLILTILAGDAPVRSGIAHDSGPGFATHDQTLNGVIQWINAVLLEKHLALIEKEKP